MHWKNFTLPEQVQLFLCNIDNIQQVIFILYRLHPIVWTCLSTTKYTGLFMTPPPNQYCYLEWVIPEKIHNSHTEKICAVWREGKKIFRFTSVISSVGEHGYFLQWPNVFNTNSKTMHYLFQENIASLPHIQLIPKSTSEASQLSFQI